jgi:ADP-ribose pyrophosphatase YjhB (NUDIX family)
MGVEPKLIKSAHLSVGAIIMNDKNEILMIDRLKKPFGWACPAGHLDEGEDPETAVIREVQEETGLTVDFVYDIGLTLQEVLKMPQETCSRGVDLHLWTVYQVEAYGELIFKADEVKEIKWIPIDEVHLLNLEPAWKFILDKFTGR